MDHASVTPRRLSYDLLNEITDGFSQERKLGSGGYGTVYKGVHKDGETIAVKLLYDMPGLDDKQFKKEFNNLICLQHHNIVRLVGYCHDARPECAEYNGRMVVADKIYRALCFEYAHNGSLHENLSDEYNGHDWRTRYRIIKGICNGLKYLHQELKPPMYHLDLKPANILLDENMVPKLADFGLSRLFGEEQTKITISAMGTLGYLPPEYIKQHVLSNKFDIFSLGVVIIKIMTGPEGYSKWAEMSSHEFVELVHGNWRARLQAPPMCEPEPEAYYEQVKTCIELALRCVEVDRHKRPSIRDIVGKMNETETKIQLWSPLLQKAQSFAPAITGLWRFEYSDLASVKDRFSIDGQPSVVKRLNMQPEIRKSGKPKIKVVSLTELFTPEQICAHIDSLRLWVGQSKAKAEKNQLVVSSENENSCQLCKVEKLTFEHPPIYCFPCGAQIKRNAPYYTGDTHHIFCIPCYNESHGDTIEVEGQNYLKARFEKKRNDTETEEWWVQCDVCECWQHQICALFNGRRNGGGQAEYTCPFCYIKEVERGLRMPLPQSAILGASDLPRTVLSDHIEERLFKQLKQERQARASQTGRSFDEVAGAEGLVVRVVSSVVKKVEVKPRFLEIFQDNYPTEVPYRSKAILLFQKIEGVEVCLFGMYVQEFGGECAFPNQRRVYLSYLDSVKYFIPEIKAASGEALRTFVYHEILIGYLEYCKQRGFTSCFIWACPSLEGEDYILYCHPEIQKTPKSDNLREWYLAMLRKATKEEIVVELTNLYDHFFVTTGECKAKVTASRLPCFDGDYWPGAAEDMIDQLRQEEDDRKLEKKGKTIITNSALKAAGHTYLSESAYEDSILMQKLGETIYPMKEDFIMVHLQYSCSHCCILMSSGKRWVCYQCRSFYICDKCYSMEQQLQERERHPSYSRDTHMLHPVHIVGVPNYTKDRDDMLESECFDTRQAFLSLCQGNHYQYDTLRRAKHSSMMVLYNLHNPTALAFFTTCNVCGHDIETGQGWRCEVCPDFDVCNGCFQKGAVNHPHTLTNHPSDAHRDAQNKEARQMRFSQIGYLEYCKQRGFTSCYIWACPPLKGEDYILYCHPEIQKTPKSDKLREWYLAMLRKATKEEIVVELTNLYDHFFITMGECKAKVTASRLPYFDGDYWPGAAEDMINQLRQEEDDRKLQKKSKTKKIITKRALKAAGHTDLSGNASKDAMLMQKLGETIYPMKEDFIMVHLQYSCSHCCILMSSGKRWVCHQCRSFYICDKCYSIEQQLEDRERHPSNSRDTHKLHPVDIVGIPDDTKDRDDILESEFFDTRQAFLSLCQGNHYQYDTLRRAKHSSMMVLYHLHNPTAPAFVTTCNVCAHDIETGQGWRCEVCPDFDVCNGCYQKGAVNHPHKLTNHPSAADRDAQNKEARQMRVSQLRKMLDLLVHASTCRSGSCQYPNCRKVKGLFRHGMQCKTRASGGCALCKKMWYMLQLHARACRDSGCSVPRCRDLKEHLRRLQQQSDSRRRAAVNEMMRQRAAEVAST